MALRGVGRTRSRVVTIQPAEPTAPVDWRQQSTETFLASMDSIGYDNALKHLEKIGSTFAKDTHKRLRGLEDKVSTAASLERAIGQTRKQRRTKEGSRTLQTILNAAAFPVDGVDEVPSLSAARRAKALGIRQHAFNSAVERAKNSLSDLDPTEAIKRGVYWFWPRAKQSNAASEELLELMRQYWHTDEPGGGGAVASRWKGKGAGLQDPVPGEEDVTCRKVKRTYRLRTRLASCFCSACQRCEYEQCYVSKTYPRLVPALQEGEVKETVITDTGVAPLDEDNSRGIQFGSRRKECKMKRITGTQLQECESAAASKIWEERGRKEEPNIFARFGRWAGF
ncbi:unnamed protein product [Ectocarpus sp. CCAP 1310/34]|nr:unnamed protein product [Ectocarpus sp. CCAP 1310/34]